MHGLRGTVSCASVLSLPDCRCHSQPAQLEKDIALKLAQKNNKELASTYAHLQRTIDCFDHCVVLLNTDAPGWRVEYANAAWTRHTGVCACVSVSMFF